MHVAFGYDETGSPIQEQLDVLSEVFEYISQGMPVRQASEYLSLKTGRYISHVGLGKKWAKEKEARQQKEYEGESHL